MIIYKLLRGTIILWLFMTTLPAAAQQPLDKANQYGEMGWRAYEQGNISKCIEYSKKALRIDSSLGYVKSNLGLCYLLKNDTATANKYYIAALKEYQKIDSKEGQISRLAETIADIDDAFKKWKRKTITGAGYIKKLYTNAAMFGVFPEE